MICTDNITNRLTKQGEGMQLPHTLIVINTTHWVNLYYPSSRMQIVLESDFTNKALCVRYYTHLPNTNILTGRGSKVSSSPSPRM